MSRTAYKKARPIADRDELVSALAEVLSNPGSSHEPRVIWTSLPTLGKSDLLVIWGRWRGIAYEERSAIILEACERDQNRLGDRIYVAIGRTPDEAIELGYLPVRVAPASHRIKPEDWGPVDEALRTEGAVQTDTGLQLRFANLDEAQEAFLRLQEKLPGPYWTIIEEISRE